MEQRRSPDRAGDEPDGARPALDEPAPAVIEVPGPSTGRYSTKAVLTVLLGAVALLTALPAPLIGAVAAVSAVILGHLALVELRVSGDRGRSLAVTGLVLGYLTVAAGLLLMVTIIAVGTSVSDEFTETPDACTSKTGDFTQRQLQRCFDQTNQ